MRIGNVGAGMIGGVLWRAALLQAGLVAAVAVALALALPRSFFAEWGWLVGPAAWLLCAALTGRLLRLPAPPTLVGAALAGAPSLVTVALGVHWLGAAIGVVLFAVWCARLARERGLHAQTV